MPISEINWRGTCIQGLFKAYSPDRVWGNVCYKPCDCFVVKEVAFFIFNWKNLYKKSGSWIKKIFKIKKWFLTNRNHFFCWGGEKFFWIIARKVQLKVFKSRIIYTIFFKKVKSIEQKFFKKKRMIHTTISKKYLK